jgi:hypothetical protein
MPGFRECGARAGPLRVLVQTNTRDEEAGHQVRAGRRGALEEENR